MDRLRRILILISFFYSSAFLIPENACSCDQQEPVFLDWAKRPLSIQTYIINKHKGNAYSLSPALQEDSRSKNEHIFCQMDPFFIVKNIISEAPKTQKTFFFLHLDVEDLSTSWTRRAPTYFKEQTDLPTDIMVNFITTCPGVCASKVNNRDGIVQLYEFDHFLLEYVGYALWKQGFFLDNVIDAIFTKKRLFKAVDPVGACVQIYNLLKPVTGLFWGMNFVLI